MRRMMLRAANAGLIEERPRYNYQDARPANIVGKAAWPPVVDEETWRAAGPSSATPLVSRLLVPPRRTCSVAAGSPVRHLRRSSLRGSPDARSHRSGDAHVLHVPEGMHRAS